MPFFHNLALFMCLVVFANGSSSMKPNNQVTLKSIHTKIATETLPLFEFGAEINTLLIQNNSSMSELNALYQSYLDGLRDHYFAKFCREAVEQPHGSILTYKRYVLAEAETAMKSASPTVSESSFVFNHQSYVKELEMDIDSYIANMQTGETIKISMKGSTLKNWPKWLTAVSTMRNKNRLKWLVTQFLIMSINFFQFELNRRMSQFAAEKRLTEIPEFPLL